MKPCFQNWPITFSVFTLIVRAVGTGGTKEAPQSKYPVLH